MGNISATLTTWAATNVPPVESKPRKTRAMNCAATHGRGQHPQCPYARMPVCPYAPMPVCPYAPMPDV